MSIRGPSVRLKRPSVLTCPVRRAAARGGDPVKVCAPVVRRDASLRVPHPQDARIRRSAASASAAWRTAPRPVRFHRASARAVLARAPGRPSPRPIRLGVPRRACGRVFRLRAQASHGRIRGDPSYRGRAFSRPAPHRDACLRAQASHARDLPCASGRGRVHSRPALRRDAPHGACLRAQASHARDLPCASCRGRVPSRPALRRDACPHDRDRAFPSHRGRRAPSSGAAWRIV
jgi:hypothetical protein